MRGRVLGAECLADAVGPDPPAQGPVPAAPPRGYGSGLAGAAFAVAALSSVLPWTRVGEGSGLFGGWGLPPRWSLLASGAAALGLLLWIAPRAVRIRPRPAWSAALAVLAALVACGGVLAIVRPPSFTHATFAPWLALASGLAGVGGSIRAGRSRSEPHAERV